LNIKTEKRLNIHKIIMRFKLFLLIILHIFIVNISGYSEQNQIQYKISRKAKFVNEPIFGGKTYIYDSNNKLKTTVILVHGVGDDASDIWTKLIPVLEKQYRVIYFDLPGFGRSDKLDAIYSPDNYAKFIKWVYDTYVDGPMYLIGHSMGGAISLCYAGTYPQTLHRLILVDAAGILHRTAFTKSLASIKKTEISKFKLFQDEIDLLSRFIETNLLGETQQYLPKDISLILENSFLRSKLLNSPQKIASLTLIYADLTGQISNIEVPVFIIWGEKDAIAPLRTGKMLSYIIPGSSLNIMPNLSHNPMIDRPSDFNNLIVKGLSEENLKIKEQKNPDAEEKNIILNGKENLTVEGNFNNIELNNCRNILIKNTTAQNIKINNSWIEIEKILIQSGKTAMNIIDSIVTITGGSITGDNGLIVSNSKIDLAGVKIKTDNAAVMTNSKINSTIVFSICYIKSKFNNRNIHDILEITEDNPL
jgi:pimeloyl-ACP methyl ester carboxylesterase